jgi:hypothetical protein
MKVNKDLNKYINTEMVRTLVNERGNPESKDMSFSKQYTDKDLFDRVEEKIHHDEIRERDYRGERGIAYNEKRLQQKKKELQDIDTRIDDTEAAIFAHRKEFDERSRFADKWWQYPLVVPITTIGKLATQIPMGWMDWFGSPALDVLENRKLNWDPKNKRFGPGPEIPVLQDKLRDLYEEKNDVIPEKYSLNTQKEKELNAMELADANNQSIRNQTSIDEALKYLDVQSLMSFLEDDYYAERK